MKLFALTIAVLAAACLAQAQSVAYSFRAKRLDPVVSLSYPVKGTPLGDLSGLIFAGYRKDGDDGEDSMPIGVGLVKTFPFGPNLSWHLGGHVLAVKGTPVDAGIIAGFSYTPTAGQSFLMGPTLKGGVNLSYRLRF